MTGESLSSYTAPTSYGSLYCQWIRAAGSRFVFVCPGKNLRYNLTYLPHFSDENIEMLKG